MSQVTALLTRIESGDARAVDELLPIVYDELRQLASRQLAREAPGETLQTTDLVHEAYLRLVGGEMAWHDTRHFFGAAADAMRKLLVDRARKKHRLRHGGGRKRIDLDELVRSTEPSAEQVLLVDDLLDLLAREHPVEAQIVKLFYFAGFTIAEAGRVLGISRSTAHRRWKFARAWIYRELRKGD
jgi:RNA polymerase sigma factor (TIGR02999 family)